MPSVYRSSARPVPVADTIETAGVFRCGRHLVALSQVPGDGHSMTLIRRAGRDEAPGGLRLRLLALVRSHPGLTAAEAARELDVHYDTARYHLERLVAGGRVRRERYGGRLRFFPGDPGYDQVHRAVLVAARSPARREILDALHHIGPTSVLGLADQLDRAASTVSEHLGLLRAAGLLACKRSGRRVRYALTERAEHAWQALA